MERGQVKRGTGGVRTSGEQCEGWGSIGVEWRGVQRGAVGRGGAGWSGMEWSGARRGWNGVDAVRLSKKYVPQSDMPKGLLLLWGKRVGGVSLR